MELTHITRRKKRTEEVFVVNGNGGRPFDIRLSRLDDDVVKEVLTELYKAQVPPIEERKRLIESLKKYEPTAKKLEGICRMSGHPVSLIEEMIGLGKDMLDKFLEKESKDSKKRIYVGIPANDPRENFYFIAHALLAGSPMILKPSAQEPVLGRDLVLYLQEQGMPKGLINIVYADTKEKTESRLLLELMKAVDVSVIMGSAQIAENQISFNAEHSRGLVLDAESALSHVDISVRYPLSCLVEHNYLVVGEENFEKVAARLEAAYQGLKAGNLMDKSVTMSSVDERVLKNVAAMLRIEEMNDSMHILYPNSERKVVDQEYIRNGALVEHFREDGSIGMNPLMTIPLPVYLTGIRLENSVEEALTDLERARKEFSGRCGAEKSMALGVYGDVDKKLMERLGEYAFDVSVNRSPFYVDGLIHQGIDLNKRLTE